MIFTKSNYSTTFLFNTSLMFLQMRSSSLFVAYITLIASILAKESNENNISNNDESSVENIPENRIVVRNEEIGKKEYIDKNGFQKGGKILALYTTKTKATIITQTQYSLSTCFSTTNTPACSGRRKRNIIAEQMKPVMEMR